MNNNALIIVDLQNDFCEGGSLEVKNASEIIPLINYLKEKYFTFVVCTQDYHPKDHISFNNSPYLNEEIPNMDALTKKWKGAFPSHCIEKTMGADLNVFLKLNGNEIILRKGENKYVESFSGFGNPNLANILKEKGIKRVFVVGLAYDFCVGNTAIDSSKLGFETFVIGDACKGISEETSLEIEEEFIKNSVTVISSEELSKYI